MVRFVLSCLILLICCDAIVLGRPPDPLADVRVLMRQKKWDQAIPKIEAYLASNRFDSTGWSVYGVALHEAKQYERSIAAGKKAIELGFDRPNQMYNIACAYALLGKKDDAITWLQKAYAGGFTDQETVESDNEIESLRQDPRFIALTGLKPPPLPAEKQWAYDLDFLVRRMEQMHWSLYANVTKERFRSEIEQLKVEALHLSPERIRARLARIIALVGDGHTVVRSFAEGQKTIERIPLHLHIFKDGVFVIGTPPAQRDLLGARITRVGTLDIDTVLDKLRPYCSVDNEMTYLLWAPRGLIWPAALQEIGASTGDKVEYTLRLPDGAPRTVTLAPVSMTSAQLGQHGRFRPGYVYANQAARLPVPLYEHGLDKALTLESLDEQKTVYFGFHEVDDNKDQPFAQVVNAMMKLIKDKHAENLIIDMRLNTGGDTGLVMPLLQTLIRDDNVNRPGHLFVIIGRYTFSAAQNTVNLLEAYTHATFVGEPTGSRPNFVGESTYIILPYSKLRVFCSSRYWQHVVSTDHRTWVQPQIAAELSFQDFAENRDPCLDAILQRLKAAPASGVTAGPGN